MRFSESFACDMIKYELYMKQILIDTRNLFEKNKESTLRGRENGKENIILRCDRN